MARPWCSRAQPSGRVFQPRRARFSSVDVLVGVSVAQQSAQSFEESYWSQASTAIPMRSLGKFTARSRALRRRLAQTTLRAAMDSR